jgi:hypothetical protein
MPGISLPNFQIIRNLYGLHLVRYLPGERRERSEAIPRTAERRNVLVLVSVLFFLTPPRGAFFLFQEEKKERGAHLAASLLAAGGEEAIALSTV